MNSCSLPIDRESRKQAPIAEGVLWYFPNALAAIAGVSMAGNEQHHPGEPLHHDRSKSGDHADCALRHLVDAGKFDSDGQRHTAKAAWRLLALLQEELEREEGAPLPRNARYPSSVTAALFAKAQTEARAMIDRYKVSGTDFTDQSAWSVSVDGGKYYRHGHPLSHVAIQMHDERLAGPEDKL